ncbi:MAG TPA: hypothetical protein PLI13_09320 [Paracoccus sp. (in: a-proteobacteria)]|nr:hypothetical protein [Paracoccus sp. (in: a-proteobacteria)]
MTITPETIDSLRGELEALPPRARTTLTARDAVVALAPEIQKVRAAGYSLADVAGQLGRRGVSISASTLGSYLRAIGRESEDQPGRRKRRRVAG